MIPTLKSNQNINMPPLLYGTAWKKEETARLVELAIENGFRGIDTACQPRHYNEKHVGDALHNLFLKGFKRSDIFLETKFTPKEGQDPNTIPYNPKESLTQQVVSSFEKSKENLQTSFIDSYVLHSPLFPFSDLLEVWRAMETLFEKKEVGQLGISNCYDLSTLEKLYEKATIKPSVVQNRFYNQSNYDKEIRLWCKSKGIIYLGFWTLTANPHILNSQTLFELSRKYKKTTAQIFYRYLTQNNIVPLIGTTNVEHMKEDMAIFEFELDNEELETISNHLI
jgi:diketogulonate reductase-like aldo/keto reductase